MTCEDQHSDGKDKDDPALDEDVLSENESYVFIHMRCDLQHQCQSWDTDRWILLVNQSTVDVFKNKKLLKSIHDARRPYQCTVMLE